MRPANERRHYVVTSPLIGWAHTQQDLCVSFERSQMDNLISPTHNISFHSTIFRLMNCFGTHQTKRASFALLLSHTLCNERGFSSMMMSSNRNIFRVNDPLCGEFTGHRWIPLTKASDAELVFSLIRAWTNGWVNNRGAGDLRRHRAHDDVIIMSWQISWTRGSLRYHG